MRPDLAFDVDLVEFEGQLSPRSSFSEVFIQELAKKFMNGTYQLQQRVSFLHQNMVDMARFLEERKSSSSLDKLVTDRQTQKKVAEIRRNMPGLIDKLLCNMVSLSDSELEESGIRIEDFLGCGESPGIRKTRS